MTPERARYFASISNEERAIRNAIAEEKGLISLCKNELNRICFSKRNVTYKMLNTSKTRVKALKKQLPQKLVYVSANEDNIHWCLNCPACHYTIVPSNFTMSFFRNYCPNCGQKLR